MLKINNITSNAIMFAYDGCHKIYLCHTGKEVMQAKRAGYELYDMSSIEECFDCSCSLRFISSWDLKTQYVAQFEDVHFEIAPSN